MVLFQGNYPTVKEIKNSIICLIKDKLSEIEESICISHLDLNLILDEAIVNAMEHGNKWDPEKSIHIRILKSHNDIQLEIEDEGHGFDHSSRINPHQSTTSLNERGRGLLLIKQFCDIEWTSRGNIIRIIIPFELTA